jgi:oxygen-independent coproporphyrinogen-3 oxidase
MESELLKRYDRGVPRYTSYPTAAQFHDGIGRGDYAEWLGALPAGAALSLYLHIPFCNSLCWFCGCHTKVVARHAPVTDYLDVLLREIGLVGDALGAPRPLGHLHFGGGSPSLLTPAELLRTVDSIDRCFALQDDTSFAIEIDPRTADRASIRAWAGAGATRASLGVQDFTPEVQRAVNRVQSLADTARVVDWLRRAGIAQINIDLMYGLPYQSVAGLERTVRKTLALAPDRLALFGYAHVPWLKRHQRLIPEEALPGALERLRQSEAAARLLVEAGYLRIGLDHFARPDDPLARAQGAGTLQRNFQGYTTDGAMALIGLGASAIGDLPQGYVQNAVPLKAYAEAVRGGHFAVARGLRLTPDDRVRRAVIQRLMCDMAVDPAAVAADFGLPPGTFDREIAALGPLARDGLVAIEGRRLFLTARGRPLVRAVCARFDGYLAASRARHSRAV